MVATLVGSPYGSDHQGYELCLGFVVNLRASFLPPQYMTNLEDEFYRLSQNGSLMFTYLDWVITMAHQRTSARRIADGQVELIHSRLGCEHHVFCSKLLSYRPMVVHSLGA